jgi:hypothetical protein
MQREEELEPPKKSSAQKKSLEDIETTFKHTVESKQQDLRCESE